MNQQIKKCIEITTALDGKKYREVTSFGFDFLSRHKPSCLKNGADGPFIETYDIKEDGQVYNVCRGCKYKLLGNSYHFPEDEITR